MAVATTKNLTILGILTIVGALVVAATQFFTSGVSAVNFEVLIAAISSGVGMILAKGAQSTGGTVPETPEAAARVAQPPTP